MPPDPTTADLLELAAGAAAGDRAALLVRAERAARGAAEQQQVADAWAAHGERDAALRCTAAALASADRGVWDHRRAAALRARLGDADGARRALADFESRLLAPRSDAVDSFERTSNGLHWRLLAEGHAELHDLAAARRCVAAGTVQAATADDWCALAKAHLELFGDGATARELLARAEAAAATQRSWNGRPDVFAHYTVAVAWSDLFDDAVRCAASLRAAAAAAQGVDDLLTVAGAWANVGRELAATEVRATLDHARERATTAEHWLAIAGHERGLAQPDEHVRDALHRARELATSDAQRHRADAALRRWLGDAAGPGGWTPAQLAAASAGGSTSALGFDADAAALFDWLRARVTEEQLATIAGADHGNEAAEHLATLREIHGDGALPVPLPWHPREVLSLRQWQEGLAVDHVERAFCCTVLCLEQLSPDHGGPGGVESTLAVLVESCLCLGRDAARRLLGLLAALLAADAQHDAEERAAFALALLLAAASLDARDARLEPVAAQLLALDAELVQHGYAHPEHGFLLGATWFDSRVAVWQRLVRELLPAITAGGPALAELRARFGAGPG